MRLQEIKNLHASTFAKFRACLDELWYLSQSITLVRTTCLAFCSNLCFDITLLRVIFTGNLMLYPKILFLLLFFWSISAILLIPLTSPRRRKKERSKSRSLCLLWSCNSPQATPILSVISPQSQCLAAIPLSCQQGACDPRWLASQWTPHEHRGWNNQRGLTKKKSFSVCYRRLITGLMGLSRPHGAKRELKTSYVSRNQCTALTVKISVWPAFKVLSSRLPTFQKYRLLP